MAHKTFISYKYSEACGLRDRIINALGDDAIYYRGETSDSPDLTDYTTETIKTNLKQMIFDTSVTIVVVSPHMKESEWIDWEIEYSLRNYSHDGTTSRTNGLVGVIMKYAGGYDWIKTMTVQPDGHTSTSFNGVYLYDIINENRCNQEPKEYFCEKCGTIDWLTGSYMSLIDEDDFLSDPSRFIDNAYDKSQKVWNYNISRTR